MRSTHTSWASMPGTPICGSRFGFTFQMIGRIDSSTPTNAMFLARRSSDLNEEYPHLVGVYAGHPNLRISVRLYVPDDRTHRLVHANERDVLGEEIFRSE